METLEETTRLNALANTLTDLGQVTVPAAFEARAEEARAALPQLEFPTTKQEYWKYTRTGKLKNKNWKFATDGAIDKLPAAVESLPNRLVIVNGHFSPAHSSIPEIDGLYIAPFGVNELVGIADLEAYTDFENTPFLALNQAMPQSGYSIRVKANTQIEDLINIVYIYSGDEIISQPRSVVYMEKGAELKINEYHFHENDGTTFANTAQEIKLEDNSRLGIDCIRSGGDESYQMQEINAATGRDIEFTQNNFTLSGGWTRNNSNVRVKGENSTIHLNGFYIPSGREHIDNHTIVDHEVAHCDSNELYRGVALDRSTAVFNGKVYVRPHAQKTNAFQSNGNILGSDDVTVNSKPELEIYADDVKCSHGSTTGQLDDDALFYLMARGIPRAKARNFLVEAFAADVVNNLVNPKVSTLIEHAIHTKLDRK